MTLANHSLGSSDTLDRSSHPVLSPAPQQRREKLQHTQAQVEHLRGHDGDGHLGTACLGSGQGRTSSSGNTLGCALDWALVLVEREHSANFDNVRTLSLSPPTLPCQVHYLQISQGPSPWTKLFLEANQSLFLHGTRQVYKAGATTGTTTGTPADELAYVRTKHDAPDGTAHFVESKEGLVVGSGDGVFASHGDSGAAICDLDGTIRGMLWGGINGGQLQHDDVSVILPYPNWPLDLSGVCFFTPINVLLEDIRGGVAVTAGLDVANVALALH